MISIDLTKRIWDVSGVKEVNNQVQISKISNIKNNIICIILLTI